jgi:hypothetical protein
MCFRPGTSDFLQQQISTMVSVNAQQKTQATNKQTRRSSNKPNSVTATGLSRRKEAHPPHPPLPHSSLSDIVTNPSSSSSHLHQKPGGTHLYNG